MMMQITDMTFKGKRVAASFSADPHGIVKMTISQIEKPRHLYNEEIMDAIVGDDREKVGEIINEYREDLAEIKSILELRYSSPARDLLDYADTIRNAGEDEGEEVEV